MFSKLDFKIAVWQFKSLRGEFYHDLAQSMKSAPGVSIVKILERYAARYPKEPTGIVCAHWLQNFAHKGRFTDAAKGTIPVQDIALLAAAESAGDLVTGLSQLGHNILGMKKMLNEVWQTLAAAAFMLIILHVFIGIEAFMVLPKMEMAMKGTVDIAKLGSIANLFFSGSHIVREWWWAWLCSVFICIAVVVWALPNYTGRYRTWLDSHVLPFQIYRDFNGAAFIIGVASLSTMVGNQLVQFNDALSIVRSRSRTPWLNWHIDNIQHNLRTNPNSRAEIFNTGVVARKIYFRILDIADYSEMSEMLAKVGSIIMVVAPIEANKRATKLRFFLLIAAVFVMVGIYSGTGNLIESFKSQIQMKMMQ